MSRNGMRRIGLVLAGVVAAAASTLLLVTGGQAAAAAAPTGLHVSGNRLLDGSGHQLVLRGVDRSGSEYACIQGFGFFDGPSDDASVAAMAAWHITAVRVPLNEDCWLGINGAPAAWSGANYRTAIAGYVSRLHAAGLVAVLDLHWTAAGGNQSTGQQDMPDADHAPAFWTSVATAYRTDGATVFDLLNEPHDVSWSCWRDGGDCGIGYQVAGLQTLLDAVRATGATNPVLVGGLAYANDLSAFLAHEPRDPVGNLMASWHSYNFNACNTPACWDSQIAPVAAQVPLVAGEVGENDCAHGYLDTLLPWLDAHQAGYLGWGWDPFGCGSFPALITGYDGTPTNFGVGLRDHLAGLAQAPGTSTPGPTTSTPTTVATTTSTSTTTAGPTTASSSTSLSSTPPGTTAPSTTAPSTTAPSTTAPSNTSPTRTTPTSTSVSTAPGSGTTPPGGLSATPSANTASAPWWWEDDLQLTSAGTVTALTATITVARTPGISSSGFWTDAPGGALTLTQTSTASGLVYRATLAAGRTLPPGTTIRLGAQYGGNGTAHAVSGDTFAVTATVDGRATAVSGVE